MQGARRLWTKRLFRRLVEVLRALLSNPIDSWAATEEMIPVAVFVSSSSCRPMARPRSVVLPTRAEPRPVLPLSGVLGWIRRRVSPSGLSPEARRSLAKGEDLLS